MNGRRTTERVPLPKGQGLETSASLGPLGQRVPSMATAAVQVQAGGRRESRELSVAADLESKEVQADDLADDRLQLAPNEVRSYLDDAGFASVYLKARGPVLFLLAARKVLCPCPVCQGTEYGMPVMFLQAVQGIAEGQTAKDPDSSPELAHLGDEPHTRPVIDFQIVSACPPEAADAEITDEALNTALASMGTVLRDAYLSRMV